jgi:hypothetical protein
VESLEARINLSGIAGLGAALHGHHYRHAGIAPPLPAVPSASVGTAPQEVGSLLSAPTAVQPLAFEASAAAGTPIDVTAYTSIYNARIEWQPGQPTPNVGWMSTSGSYVEYAVVVPAAGAYSLNMKLASLTGIDMNVSVNGMVTSELKGDATGGWAAYISSGTTLNLSAGTNIIRLTSMAGTQYNIGSLAVAPVFAAPASTPVGDSAAIPIDSYSSIYNSKLEQQSTGAADIGWVSPSGAYVEYTINVATAGAYSLTVGAGSVSTASFDLYDNGSRLTSFQVPNTLTWQNSTPLSQTIQLAAGTQTLRFVATNGTQYNLFNIGLVRQDAGGVVKPAASQPAPDVAIAQRWMTSFNELDITGTPGNDTIVVTQVGTTLLVTANGYLHPMNGNFGDIVISGGAGDDRIIVDSSVTTSARLYGNAGNNVIINLTSGKGTIVTLGGGVDTVTGDGIDTSYWVDPQDVVNASAAERSFGRVHIVAGFYQPFTTTVGATGYVSTALDGANLIDPAGGVSTTRLTSSSLWGTGPVQEDINQGQVGDCFFLSALQSLSRLQTDKLREMAADLGDGSYAVQFTRNGVTEYVRVDGDLPTNSWGGLNYNRPGASGDQWASIMEKAYALFRTGQNSYASLDTGWTVPVYWDLGFSNATTFGLPADQNAFYTTVNTALSQKRAVDVGTLSTISGGAPLATRHVYSVLGVSRDASGTVWVTLRNPWGFDGYNWDANSWDGILTINYAMLKSNVSSGSILT